MDNPFKPGDRVVFKDIEINAGDVRGMEGVVDKVAGETYVWLVDPPDSIHRGYRSRGPWFTRRFELAPSKEPETTNPWWEKTNV